MSYVNPEALLGTEWVARHLGDPAIRIVDATHFMPIAERDAREEFELRHVPGAVHFDIDVICDTASPLPNMLPDAARFSELVGRLGIGNQHKVVVYDGNGNYSAAARAWWMFRVFGHDDVAVMDGGLGRWLRERRPLEHDLPDPQPATFVARFRPELVRDFDAVRANLETRAEQIVDTRTAGRYAGLDAEPRPVKRKGRIPGSLSVPFTSLMDLRRDFAIRSPDQILATFREAGVDFGKPIVFSCGSGMTAAVNALALYLMGRKDAAIYDGSWVEWGNRDDAPIEV